MWQDLYIHSISAGTLFIKPGNFFLQKFEKCRNFIFGPMWCWDSLASGLPGPILLKSCWVWGWVVPKTFQGLHFVFPGSLSCWIDIWAIRQWNKFEEKSAVWVRWLAVEKNPAIISKNNNLSFPLGVGT